MVVLINIETKNSLGSDIQFIPRVYIHLKSKFKLMSYKINTHKKNTLKNLLSLIENTI